MRQAVLSLYFDKKKDGKMFDKADIDELVKEYRDTVDLSSGEPEYTMDDWIDDMDVVEQQMLEEDLVQTYNLKVQGLVKAKANIEKSGKVAPSCSSSSSSSARGVATRSKQKRLHEKADPAIVILDDDTDENLPKKKLKTSSQKEHRKVI